MTNPSQPPSSMDGPHQGQPVLYSGEPIQSARAALILIHGRGGNAEDMLSLAAYMNEPGFAYVAPKAYKNIWYPNRFTAPLETNEPWLSSALRMLNDLVDQITKPGGSDISSERVFLLGFSQGGCLVLDYAIRHARRFGGIAGLSSGLIGPDDTTWNYPGNFEGTPVFLGCSDIDPHIPGERVDQTAQIFRRMMADVTVRFYPGMGHTINEDEIDMMRGMMREI